MTEFNEHNWQNVFLRPDEKRRDRLVVEGRINGLRRYVSLDVNFNCYITQ